MCLRPRPDPHQAPGRVRCPAVSGKHRAIGISPGRPTAAAAPYGPPGRQTRTPTHAEPAQARIPSVSPSSRSDLRLPPRPDPRPGPSSGPCPGPGSGSGSRRTPGLRVRIHDGVRARRFQVCAAPPDHHAEQAPRRPSYRPPGRQARTPTHAEPRASPEGERAPLVPIRLLPAPTSGPGPKFHVHVRVRGRNPRPGLGSRPRPSPRTGPGPRPRPGSRPSPGPGLGQRPGWALRCSGWGGRTGLLRPGP
jgi:translation initiation factor IF-2